MTYLRARYYDSENGRFISEDPHWNVDNMIYSDEPKEQKNILNNEIYYPEIGSVMQSNNLYGYCLNNPNKYKDPSGELTISLGGSISAAFLLKLGISGEIVIDDNGNIGVLVSASIGGGSPTLGASGTITITSADEIFDLNGIGASGGGSYAVAGGDLIIGKARDGSAVLGIQVSGGVSTPLPEFHASLDGAKVVSLNWLPTWVKNMVISEFQEAYDKLSDDIKNKVN